MEVLASILGGTALLLYGIRLLGEGLQRGAGARLRHVPSTLTGNAEKVIRHKAVVNMLERRLREQHIRRLREGLRESIDASSIHLDILGSLKRANSPVTGIAYAVLGKHAVSES